MKRQSGLVSDALQYRALLLAKKSELFVEIGSEVPPLSEFGHLADDDQAQVAHDQFISLELQRRGYRTVKEIDAALDRLSTGDYGVCTNCGEAINPRRLSALPWAAYCIRCQEHMGHGVEEFHERAA